MSGKVYFLPWNRRNELYEFLKKARAFDHVKARHFLAIKMHFGEDGNEGYIKPEYLKPLVEIAREKTAFPFLTDASTIYVGKRSDAYHHALLANKHGFTIENCGCPVIIADGLRGNASVNVEINQKHCKSVSIAHDIHYSDSFIFLNHFKGHEITGFGGALKNIGMGCGSKAGKYVMHHNAKPDVNTKLCIGCGVCIKWCPAEALKLENKKIVINVKKCIGCGECVLSCPKGVFQLGWNEDVKNIQEKIVEYCCGVLQNKKSFSINFLNHITKFCDCYTTKGKVLMDDIGIMAGADPVAVDKASVDMVNKVYGKDFCKEIFPEIDYNIQFEYAEKLGLGTTEYELVEY
ncbi:MAG: DUF362 domain-containing protein [Endomicrobiaceae bacterium]|nr:DUF362 domain-containing protein [Endomicrobiaceae bacterium]